MIFINSMFNQDAGVPIFPTEFIEAISKIKKDRDSLCFYDLNIIVYNQINEFVIYEQLKYIFGGYTKFMDKANEILINTYRYEAMPNVELLTYLIHYNDLSNEKVLKGLTLCCKEYGLEFDLTLNALRKLFDCIDALATQINALADDIIYLNMDSVASVSVGLLFSSLIKGKQIIAIGNQINVPEVANYAKSLGSISEIENPHTNAVYNSKKFIKILEELKNQIYLYPLYYGLRIIPIKLTEGCSQKCNFCTERMYWSCDGKVIDRFKQKNLEESLQEIKYIISNLDVDGITFNDCMVDFSLSSFSAIVDYVVENRIFCSGSTRVDCLNDDKIEVLSKMNFTNLIIGLETFNKSSVSVYSKGNTDYLNDFEQTFKLLKENGIEPQINIVFDHPFEKQEDVLKSIQEDQFSLQKMKDHGLFILDLSIGDMLVNYPSKNYFDLKCNNSYEIIYHSIDDDNINLEIRKAIHKIPFKALAKYETKINKQYCVDSLSSIMNFGTDVSKRVTTLGKHWENLNCIWKNKNIYIKAKVTTDKQIKGNEIFSKIILSRIVSYRALIKDIDDIQDIVNTILILYYMNLIEFIEEGKGRLYEEKKAVVKAPYTIRTHKSGAASLHIAHVISILKQNGNLVKYCDFNTESFFLWSKMMSEIIDRLLEDSKFDFMLPSEILLLLERLIIEKKFGPSKNDLSLEVLLNDDVLEGLTNCLDIAMGDLTNQIDYDTDEVIIFVAPSIFFHLVLIKKIKEIYPDIHITLMDEFTFEPATPYFYYLITGYGIMSENLNSFYHKDSYNDILSDFIQENVNQIVIGEGYDFLLNKLVSNEKEIFNNCFVYKSRRIDLDLLPLPYFDDMISIYDSLELEFTRGCSYRCEFCERTRMMENKVSRHTAEYIIEELMYLKKYNFDYLTIIDCSVNLDEDYMIKMLQKIKDSNISIRYQCNMRGKMPNIQLLKLLKETGCFEIAFGIETIDNDLLKDMNKHQDITIIEDMVDKVNEYGMSLMLFLILGFPTEKYDASQNTLKFLIDLNSKTHLDVVELEVYHPGIIQHLNPIRYNNFNIEVNEIKNFEEIKDSSLSDFRPGMTCALHYKEGMSRTELKKALINYIRECKRNDIYLETFFWEKLVRYYV